MSVTNKSVRSNRTNNRNDLKVIFNYFLFKSYEREMKKKDKNNGN